MSEFTQTPNIYIRYLIGLLQLFKNLTKTLVKEFVLQQRFILFQGLLSEEDPGTLLPDIRPFPTIVRCCKM